MPLVEVVAGEKRSDHQITRVKNFLKDLGMIPVVIKKEIDAFVADRMLEAMWREGLWLIRDEICTTEELDQIITSSFGIRFAQMGMFESYRIAGGKDGMRHFLNQFGPALQWPWSRLTDVPPFDDAFVEQICSQSDKQSGKYTISELEEIRDNNLVEIQKALKNNRWASGVNLSRYEKNLFDEQSKNAHEKKQELDSKLIISFSKIVPPEWADYNGHMTEYRYLNCFGDASDAVMLFIGCDREYINNGNSYFTVETNIRHLKEIKVGEEVYIETKILKGSEKKLHLIHLLKNTSEELLAIGEHLLLHVSLETRKTCPASRTITNNLIDIQKSHERVEIGVEPKMSV
jgi:carnitine 3-dehydrogenase